MSTYLLFLKLPKMINISVGKLGQFSFPAGQYLYVGRAKKNLEARLKRHQRKIKLFTGTLIIFFSMQYWRQLLLMM